MPVWLSWCPPDRRPANEGEAVGVGDAGRFGGGGGVNAVGVLGVAVAASAIGIDQAQDAVEIVEQVVVSGGAAAHRYQPRRPGRDERSTTRARLESVAVRGRTSASVSRYLHEGNHNHGACRH